MTEPPISTSRTFRAVPMDLDHPIGGMPARQGCGENPAAVSAERLWWGEERDEMEGAGGRCCPAEDVLGNIGYVRRLWAAFETGGVQAMAELVAPDARWRPIAAEGRVLNGTRDLEEFWSSREVEMPSLRMFHGTGDDVLVEAEYRREDADPRTVWLLYRFDEDRLVEAIGFEDDAQARSYGRQ